MYVTYTINCQYFEYSEYRNAALIRVSFAECAGQDVATRSNGNQNLYLYIVMIYCK